MKESADQLIVALDVSTMDQAIQLVDSLGETIRYYKIDTEAFYGMGHALLTELEQRNKAVFLDLKLHDIPTTVSRSISRLCEFSPALITLHAAGGANMLKAAVKAANDWAEQSGKPRPKLLAITVLTSLSERDWVEIGYQSPIRESVLRMAVMCKEAGIDGVVAAPQEAAAIRALCGSDFIIATAGIRLTPEQNGDQSRTATPAQALKVGADYLIVGRPIFSAHDPEQVVTDILQDMTDYKLQSKCMN